jgi:hypothetical protein
VHAAYGSLQALGEAEAAEARGPSVVDEVRHPAQLDARARHRRVDLPRIDHVDADAEHGRTRGPDLVVEAAKPVLVRVPSTDGEARRRGVDGDLAADPAGRAGDDDDRVRREAKEWVGIDRWRPS